MREKYLSFAIVRIFIAAFLPSSSLSSDFKEEKIFEGGAKGRGIFVNAIKKSNDQAIIGALSYVLIKNHILRS
ncbi:hypothetical protein IM40_09125 [Candidatus Paracaedimonas acanthamoebae]|nr:hypothetical protein IM40_09125 [Candidatus Paracaedimonas acanthamoebae]